MKTLSSITHGDQCVRGAGASSSVVISARGVEAKLRVSQPGPSNSRQDRMTISCKTMTAEISCAFSSS
jgi:hypothetical protein